MEMFLLACVTFWGLRFLTLISTRIAVDDLYLTANSRSMYKKIKPELKKKNRFLWSTRLCFWSAKSQETKTLHFFIVLNTVAVLSIILAVIFLPMLKGNYAITGLRLQIYDAYCWFHFCCMVSVGAWNCWTYNKKLKKKRSPRK